MVGHASRQRRITLSVDHISIRFAKRVEIILKEIKEINYNEIELNILSIFFCCRKCFAR